MGRNQRPKEGQLRRPSFILLATLAAFSVVGSASAYEVGTDRPGSDIRNFEIGAKLMNYIDPCVRACGGDSRCKAWTVVRPGVQGPNARCWLKHAVPRPVRNNCCTSGIYDRNPGTPPTTDPK